MRRGWSLDKGTCTLVGEATQDHSEGRDVWGWGIMKWTEEKT